VNDATTNIDRPDRENAPLVVLPDTAPAPTAWIRACLVEDSDLLRRTLRYLLDRTPDIRVVAEASNAKGALRAIAVGHPDVVVLDVRLPDRDAFEILAAIRETKGRPPVILITGDPSVTRDDALRAGARGFISKAEETNRLPDAIRVVVNGGAF